MELILVDTSVWVDHIRRPLAELIALVQARRCLLHPYVLAEIALGNLPDWPKQVTRLRALPSVRPLSQEALLEAIGSLALQGSGLGFTDAHLLASASAEPGVKLWTRDRRLAARAETLELAWSPAD